MNIFYLLTIHISKGWNLTLEQEGLTKMLKATEEILKTITNKHHLARNFSDLEKLNNRI